VAAVRPAFFDEFFPAEAGDAISAFACDDFNGRFVYEFHGDECCMGPGTRVAAVPYPDHFKQKTLSAQCIGDWARSRQIARRAGVLLSFWGRPRKEKAPPQTAGLSGLLRVERELTRRQRPKRYACSVHR